MSSPLKDRIAGDVKDAMKAREKQRLGALRLVSAEIKKIEVDQRIDLDDAGVLVVLDKMAKQRRDSREQYLSAGRDDLAAQEQFELDLLAEYLPRQLEEAEIQTLVDEQAALLGASGMQDMGKVMGALKPLLAGKADMAAVGKLVKAKLAG